jgi:hypothetical protein
MPASPPTATELAEAAGFDISLIRTSLSYTYEQRVLQHQAALELMLELEKAGRTLRESATSPDRLPARR